jgi:hypothetical protein
MKLPSLSYNERDRALTPAHIAELEEYDSVLFFRLKQQTMQAIKNLYLVHDMTAREICDLYGCECTPEIQRVFFTLFGAKGKGHGGSRRGSGQKKKTVTNN